MRTAQVYCLSKDAKIFNLLVMTRTDHHHTYFYQRIASKGRKRWHTIGEMCSIPCFGEIDENILQELPEGPRLILTRCVELYKSSLFSKKDILDLLISFKNMSSTLQTRLDNYSGLQPTPLSQNDIDFLHDLQKSS